ncbi:MAG: hypothetical protein WBE26_09970 [Phycisphaerae bacterium]
MPLEHEENGVRVSLIVSKRKQVFGWVLLARSLMVVLTKGVCHAK